MSQITPSGSAGVPASSSEITSYTVVNQSVPTAATEVEIVVPTTAVWLQIYCRTEALTKIAFGTGESGTLYSTLNPGDAHTYMKQKGTSLSLYVQCTKDAQVIEVTYGHA